MTENPRDKTVLAGLGLVCVTVLELAALRMGIDGKILSVVVGAICTIVGYAFGVTKAVAK